MEQIEKITIDDVNLHKIGFKDVAVDVILREGRNTMLTATSGNKFSFSDEIKEFFPLGNPPAFFAGFAFKHDEAYSTIFKTKNIAINLRMHTKEHDFIHPIFILPSLINNLDDILENYQTTKSYKITLEENTKVDISDFSTLIGLDSIVYSILTHRKIVIISSYTQGVDFIKEAIYYIPNDLRKIYGFVFNIKIDDDSIIFYNYDPDLIDNYEMIIQDMIEKGFDVMNIEENTFYGEYSSSITQTLANILKNDGNYKDYVTEIFTMAKSINIDQDITEIASAMNVDYADAELLMQIYRSNNHA